MYNDLELRMIPMVDIVEEGPWHDEGKYSARFDVFKVGDRFFWLQITRRGNHWDGYDFEYDLECPEVTPVEITTTAWEVKY